MKKLIFFLFFFIFSHACHASEINLDNIQTENILDYEIEFLQEGQQDNNVIFYYKIPLIIKEDIIDYQGELYQETIFERTINSETFYTNDGKKLLKIYSKPKFFYENGDWYLINVATTTLNNIQEKILDKPVLHNFINIANAAETYWTSCDGDVSHLDAGGTNWTDIRTGAGTNVSQAATEERGAALTKTGGNYEWLHRGTFVFDTSTIGTDTIDSASFFIVGSSASTYSWTDNNGDVILTGGDESIIQCPLQSGDFNSYDFNNYSYKEWGNITKDNATYTEFELTTDGKNYINKTGNTVFGLIWRADLSNIDPSAPGDSNFYWWSSEETGTSKDPYLLITLSEYTPPVQTSTSTGYIINYMEFSLILILFVIFFLLIGVFGNKITKWLQQSLYDRY